MRRLARQGGLKHSFVGDKEEKRARDAVARGKSDRGRKGKKKEKKKGVTVSLKYMKIWLIGQRVKAPWLDPADAHQWPGLHCGTIVSVNADGESVVLKFDDGYIWNHQPLSSLFFLSEFDKSCVTIEPGIFAHNIISGPRRRKRKRLPEGEVAS